MWTPAPSKVEHSPLLGLFSGRIQTQILYFGGGQESSLGTVEGGRGVQRGLVRRWTAALAAT